MFHKVLVPLDGSSGSEKAVPYAQGLAKALGTAIAVCHVITSPAAQNGKREQRDAERYLAKMAHQFRLADISAEKILRRGEAPLEIQKAAQEWGADAIVMATRSRRRFEKLVLGSVADVIVRDSRLPVLLVSQRRPAAAKRAA